jgi:poly(hydroxyalkanoate) depolymerase family esterase
MLAVILAALAQVADFGSNPGALDMYEYIPADLPPNAPLVVVMHGCTQTAAAMETAGWNALADANHFAVIYPQQRSANQPLSCFTWYATGDISRGMGEAASIVAMVDHEASAHAIDKTRVYVTGLSAGGAFVAVMLAAYPDRFAAGAAMSGIAYGCATDVNSGTACERGVTKTAAQWGDLVRAADPAFSGSYPRLQIWQGTSDTTVDPSNATALVDQWTNVHGAANTPDATDMISTATRTRYASGAVELYLITGMGHAIATGTDALGTCPAGTGAYFADEKICSTLRAAAFFGLDASGSGSGSDGGGGGGGGGGDGGGGGGNEPTSDGGCTVGGAQGWALGLVAAAVIVRRRRRGALTA